MIHYLLLLQAAEEHATPGKIALEYIGFLSFFGVYGALGFHFQVLKSLRRENAMNIGGSSVDRADRRAAALGFTGATLMVVTLVVGLMQRGYSSFVLTRQRAGAGSLRAVARGRLAISG